MAGQQLLQNKAGLLDAGVSAARMPAVDHRSGDRPIGSGYIGAMHSFANVPLFLGDLGDGGTPTDAGSGPEIGATHDAGSGTREASDAGTAGDAGSGDAGVSGNGAADGGAADAGSGDAGSPNGGNAGQAQPAPACIINSKTAVHAPDMTPDTRTTIGVCETVIFDIGGQVADWSANNGWPGSRTARARFEWAAPELPGTSTITARLPVTGQTCSIDMDVVAPQTIRFANAAMLPMALPAGTVGGQAAADLFVGPRNVNFGWIGIHEDPGPATNVSGYFNKFTAAQLAHAPTPGFQRLDFNNHQQDTIGVNVPLTGPFTAGTWDWEIPNRYQCFNSTGTGHSFTRTTERFRMTAGGAFHVTKRGTGGGTGF